MAPSLLQASAASYVLLSLGHTIAGRDWTSDPRFKAIARTKPWACGTVGWYQVSSKLSNSNLPSSMFLGMVADSRSCIQGSGFLLLTAGLLHWQWAKDPSLLQDPVNKAIAGIANFVLWASTVWYAKHGIHDTAAVVGLSAALQAFGVGKAIL
ncbi:uncharacterized protein N7515_009964 [Penicillium bovifimosum]|uniref:Uncharacterized protein n=1 Tax=Penicillium bovifimosum TaxID=126998 RepID=A0A9W9KTQ8_9EURO|nr:uncharacterized protein N7515_009964 [Penicillium bovifimosum]KAJ5120576.1 hypothetical protein N7515_009964 [Penicillium bovifimosum]